MSLFGMFDYQKAGKGIAKNAPKKKPFFHFWELYFRKFGKLISLNMLTFLFCLPIVTIGPAMAGMTKILRNYVLEKNAFIFHDFWKGFTQNWKQAFPIGIINLFVAMSTGAALSVYPQLAESSESGKAVFTVLCVISVSFALTVVMMNFYAMPMIVATDLSFANVIKNSFFLTCIALKKNIITLLIVAAVAVTIYISTMFHILTVLLIPFWAITFIGFIVMFNSYPEIQKYVINPFYEAKGEENPEYAYLKPADDEEEVLFVDKGGEEAPVDTKGSGKKKNKTIS